MIVSVFNTFWSGDIIEKYDSNIDKCVICGILHLPTPISGYIRNQNEGKVRKFLQEVYRYPCISIDVLNPEDNYDGGECEQKKKTSTQHQKRKSEQ